MKNCETNQNASSHFAAISRRKMKPNTIAVSTGAFGNEMR